MQMQLTVSNAYFVMGMTKRELRKAGASKEEIAEYFEEAQESDYPHLLEVTRRYIEKYGIEAITV